MPTLTGPAWQTASVTSQVQRLSVLEHKLERASSYLSLYSLRNAQYYLLSSFHDLRAMHAIASAAAEQLHANAVCE